MQRISHPNRLGRSRVMQVGWWLLITATVINGLAAGYFPVSFSMASSPDRGSYLVSAGAYGAAGLVLFAAAVGVKGLRGPCSAQWTAVWVGVVLNVLAVSSMVHALRLPSSPAPAVSIQRGIEAVLLMPWSLALVVASIPGTYYLWVGSRRPGDRRHPGMDDLSE